MKKISRRVFVHNFGIGVGASAIMTSLPSFVTLPENNPKTYNDKKLNIALCGLGRYAGYLADGLEISKFCRLAGIITGTPSKAIDWGKKYNIPDKNIYNYQNFDEIIHNKDIDLVYVVLPNAMHKEFVIRAAKAGKHVIVEKPMAITEHDCQEMMDACKKAGRLFKDCMIQNKFNLRTAFLKGSHFCVLRGRHRGWYVSAFSTH